MIIEAQSFGCRELSRAITVGTKTLTFYIPTKQIANDFKNRIRLCAQEMDVSITFKEHKEKELEVILDKTT